MAVKSMDEGPSVEPLRKRKSPANHGEKRPFSSSPPKRMRLDVVPPAVEGHQGANKLPDEEPGISFQEQYNEDDVKPHGQ